MAKFRTYNKLYYKGKPQGHAFVYHRKLEAKNESAARAKIGRINADWNKNRNNKGYTVKTAKVVPIKRHGGVKVRRRTSSPFGFNVPNFRMPRFRGGF
jgi:hypothetical protein